MKTNSFKRCFLYLAEKCKIFKTHFLFKKVHTMSTFSDFRLDCLLLITSSATENTCSTAGKDVAGTHRYLFSKLG